jgi:hypothetical protein
MFIGFFTGLHTSLFFPTVLAQNRCNFSRLTGLPNSDFHLEPEKKLGSVTYRGFE